MIFIPHFEYKSDAGLPNQVSVLSYWVSTFIWDFVSFLFPASLAIVLFYIFGMFTIHFYWLL